MTQLVQSLVERLAQLPEPVQNRLAQHFLTELEAAETQMAQQPRNTIRSSRHTPSLCSGSRVSCLPGQRASPVGAHNYERQDKPRTGQWCACNVLRIGAFLFFGHTGSCRKNR